MNYDKGILVRPLAALVDGVIQFHSKINEGSLASHFGEPESITKSPEK